MKSFCTFLALSFVVIGIPLNSANAGDWWAMSCTKGELDKIPTQNQVRCKVKSKDKEYWKGNCGFGFHLKKDGDKLEGKTVECSSAQGTYCCAANALGSMNTQFTSCIPHHHNKSASKLSATCYKEVDVEKYEAPIIVPR